MTFYSARKWTFESSWRRFWKKKRKEKNGKKNDKKKRKRFAIFPWGIYDTTTTRKYNSCVSHVSHVKCLTIRSCLLMHVHGYKSNRFRTVKDCVLCTYKLLRGNDIWSCIGRMPVLSIRGTTVPCEQRIIERMRSAS